MAALKEKTFTKTRKLFHIINNYTCFMGLLNFWGENARVPAISTKRYYILFYKCMSVFIFILLFLEISAIFKLGEFDAKQTSDWIMLALVDPVFYSLYLNVLYYKRKVEELLMRLTVILKNVYNDKIIEQRMVKRSKIYIVVFLLLSCLTLALYGVDGIIQVIRLDKTFTTTITIWPDADDRSNLATAVRIMYYLIWWFLVARSTNAYILAIATTICLSHQFQNLQSYFYGLERIFQDNGLNQNQKEEKYQKAFKIGIKMHSDTLWCSRQCEIVYGVVYSGQIIISVTGLAILMLQMLNSERNVSNTLAILTTASTILLTNGIYMLSAGDVTVEASIVAASLATAMYSSGWHNCKGASLLQIRQLVLTAMTQAQKPVIIRGCSVTEMSYSSYLSIVKSSYSIFSVVY